MPALKILFWASLALIGYTYVLFPLWVALRGRLAARPFQKVAILPRLSLVASVYNEEDVLAHKLENITALDYPVARLEVILASDGSSDGSNALLAAYSRPNYKFLPLGRVGKAEALNAAIAQAGGEILVFSDANSIYRPDALRRLVQPFADPQVGAVAGNQVYVKTRRASLSHQGESSYWNFDRLLKVYQSAAGSVTSATGSIYAIRRELVEPVIEGVTDDFYTSTAAIVRGKRLVFEPEAVSYEPPAGESGKEFRRKVRIITRGLRAVQARKALLNPFRYGFYAVQLFSHKVLRRLVVFPLLVLLVSAGLLWNAGWLYRLAFIGQAAFYALAVAGAALRNSRSRAAKLLTLPFFFCLVNAASLLAAVNVLRGESIAHWEPQRADHAGRAGAA